MKPWPTIPPELMATAPSVFININKRRRLEKSTCAKEAPALGSDGSEASGGILPEQDVNGLDTDQLLASASIRTSSIEPYHGLDGLFSLFIAPAELLDLVKINLLSVLKNDFETAWIIVRLLAVLDEVDNELGLED
jgi:hypothetical protein